MTLAVALVFALQGSQNSITLSGPAARAEKLIPQIGQQAGVKLAVSATMADEVLLINVQSLPFNTLLKHIAEATSGKFIEEADGLRLVADEDRRRQEARQEYEARLTRIRNQINRKLADANKPKTNEAKAAENPELDFGMGRGDSTEQRALARILAMVSPEEIAALKPGRRIVFSSAPTQMQKGFRGNAPAMVQDWIVEHNKSVAASKAAGAGAAPDDEFEKQTGQTMPAFIKDMVNSRSQPFVGAIGKVLLVVEPGPFFSGLNAKLQVFDSRGKAAVSSQANLEDGPMRQIIQDAADQAQGKKKPAPPQNQTPIVFSPDSVKIRGLGARGGDMMKLDRKIDPALLSILARPDEREPLSFTAGEALAQWSKKRGKPIVASIPDSAFGAGILSQGDELTSIEKLDEALQSGDSISLTNSAEVLIVRPKQPAHNRENRVNRASLTTLANAAINRETPSLDELANYALKNGPILENPIASTYLSVLAPTSMQMGMLGSMNWTALRLFANLSPVHRQTLARGGSITAANLTPGGQQQLAQLIFGADAQLEVATPGKEPLADDLFSRSMRMAMGSNNMELNREPTEVLPSGLLGSTPINLKASEEPVVRLGAAGSPGATLGMSELAIFKLVQDFIPKGEAEEMLKMPETARRGVRRSYAFRAELRPGVSVSWNLQDDSIPSGSASISMNNLPSDMQSLLAQKVAELKKSPLGMLGAMGAMGGPSGIKP